jgi:hypothetical protein
LNKYCGIAKDAVHCFEVREPACQRQRLIAILRPASGQCQGDRCARSEPHHAAQAEHRVQHRADGVRERGICLKRRRIRGRAAPPKKARPVRLELDVAEDD